MGTETVLLASVLAALFLFCVAVGGPWSKKFRRRVAERHGSYPAWVLRVGGYAATAGLAAYVLFPGYRSGMRYVGVCVSLVVVGWLLCAHAYVKTAAAVETITRHPWLRATKDEGLRERVQRVRHVYPDWRYLVNAHYGVPWRSMSWGGFLLTFGGFLGFAFDGTVEEFLAGMSLIFGLLSVFILSTTLRGYQTYSGSFVTVGEKAHNPEFVDALAVDVKKKDDPVVPPVDHGSPSVYRPERDDGVPDTLVSEYPPDKQEREGGWATSVLSFLKGYYRATGFLRAYLPPRFGFSLTVGIVCLALGALFFLVTGLLVPTGEAFGISEQTVAAYVAVWVVVAFWVFVSGLYLMSRAERRENN